MIDSQVHPHVSTFPSRIPQRGGNYHYHHGLRAGENTLEGDLVRVLVRGMNMHDGAFAFDTYLEDYIKVRARARSRCSGPPS